MQHRRCTVHEHLPGSRQVARAVVAKRSIFRTGQRNVLTMRPVLSTVEARERRHGLVLVHLSSLLPWLDVPATRGEGILHCKVRGIDLLVGSHRQMKIAFGLGRSPW